eukprot:5743384-Pyramimonas_sp.AAC.1
MAPTSLIISNRLGVVFGWAGGISEASRITNRMPATADQLLSSNLERRLSVSPSTTSPSWPSALRPSTDGD